MAEQIYFSVFTTQGLALLTEAIQNGTKLGITSMAFGDGGGSLPTPQANVESLVNEVHRTSLNSLAPDPKNANWLRAEAIIASAIGGFNIRELGLYAGDVLVAYSNYPPTFKPNPADGTARIMTFRMVLQIDNVANFELVIDPDVVLATITYVDNKNDLIKLDIDKIKGKIDQTSIFGSSGISIPIGSDLSAHYGWGGILNFESGKWVLICRKAASHATLDNAQLVALDSHDKGRTWINERVILESTMHDLRPDPPKIMANNRGGLIVNRASVASGHFSPIFLYSDDFGVTWKQKTIETESGYTFSSTGGFLDFPTSVGGADNTGFIAYGYLSAGGLDALYTLDNGETWLQQQEIATINGDLKSLSEWSGCRLGNTDRWIFTVRSSLLSTNTWNQKLTVFTTNNPLNWGSAVQSTFGLGGNPPCIIYDDKSNTINLLNVSRGGRAVAGMPENCIAYAQIDAETAYNTQLVLPNEKYRVLTNLPHWLTGYLAPFQDENKWFTSLTCGELGFNGGGASCQILLGDFITAATELTKLVNFLIKQQKTTSYLEVTSTDDSTYPVRIYSKNRAGYINVRPGYMDFNPEGPYSVLNSSKPIKMNAPIFFGGLDSKIDGANASIHAHVDSSNSPAIRTLSESTSVRQHYVFHNLNGVVGSITTNGSGTIFNTTSDETLKSFNDEFSGEYALKIIKSDPVRNYKWNATNEKSIGWGAQTSYGVSPDLASKGGWYNEDGIEVPEGTENATYIRWGMDYSRRAPYLWAAVAYLSKQIESLQEKLNQSQNPPSI